MTWRELWQLTFGNEHGNFNFSERSSSSRQRIELPPASPEETELRNLQLQEFKRQLAERQQFEASPTFALQKQVEEKALQNIMARLTGQAPVLAPEEQQRLDEIFGATQRQGEEDLARFAQEQAGARGLRRSDSPIFNETLRQRRLFGENLAAQKSAAALNLGDRSTLFNQTLKDFQQGLREQSALNRQGLLLDFSRGLFGERLAQGTKISRGFQSGFDVGLSGSDIGGLAGGIGALACWIAASIYGFGTPEFFAARHWIMEEWQGSMADAVRWVYRAIGPWLAPKVRQHRWLRAVLKPLFDIAVRRGQGVLGDEP
jgi:hypothetical protein